jgi:alanyl-tRNA synthetase
MSQMVFAVVDKMGDAYPELHQTSGRTAQIIAAEEERFWRTLEIGLKRLDEDLAPLIKANDFDPQSQTAYSGERAFKLYDTFGLPLDFMVDATRDLGIPFDQAGFDAAMADQRERARASWKGAAKQTANPAYQQIPKSTFEGYRKTRSHNCEVIALIK